MKTMKKVLAFMLALAMVVTAVPVTNAEAATGLPKSKSYYAGKTYTLELTTPSSWKSVSTKWSATNNNTKAVAISDKKAKSVTVKALKKGKAVVTAKVTYKKGGVSATKTYKCNVRVKAPTIAITDKAIEVEVDKTADIVAKFVPASATVSFESEDSNIAAVKDLGNGKAVVTGVTPGQSTNIKAYLRCGKKVKLSIVKVTVTGEALEDGFSAKLTNQFLDYENTVVGGHAYLRFYYGKGGKGVSGKTISYTDGVVTQHAVTDANGYAFLTVSRPGLAKANYSATVVATGEKCTGTIVFATIGTTDVYNVNGINDTYKNLGFKDLVPSANDYKAGGAAPEPVVETDGVWTTKQADNVNLDNDYVAYTTKYVASQQVSPAGTTDHKVGFDGGLPSISFPGDNSSLNVATKFEQGIVDNASGEYHAYDTVAKYVELSVDPNELTYATLNFKDLKLSAETKLTISSWVDKASAEAETAGKQIGTPTVVYGPHDQANFAYQIPLEASKAKTLCIKVKIEAQGQVDLGLNKGFELVNITGVYKNKNDGSNVRTELLKDAKIEWSIVKPVYSEERIIDGAYFTNAASNTELVGGDVKKVTYRVPVFPYTGNAIVTTYDKNGKVLAYYACATENDGTHNHHNVNVLKLTRYCYKISEEEAFNSVGTVSQEGTLVTVNSELSGVTNLVGKITGVAGLDATNSEIYTSVQWNPIKNVADVVNHSGAIAFKGQNLEVVAQLVDKNGNAVSTSGMPITFKYEKAGVETGISNNDTVVVGAWNNVNPAVVSIPTVTDSKGQAKLVLKAANVAAVLGVTAKAKNDDYNVVIKIGNTDAKIADLYWIDAFAQFIDSAINTDYFGGTWNSHITVSKNDANMDGLNPSVGSSWEYGFKAAANALPNVGVWANFCVVPNDLKIDLSVESGNVATVNLNTGVNGRATATSTKSGHTKLSGKVDGSPVSGKTVSFVLLKPNWGAYVNTVQSCGTGAASVNNKLTLDIEWGKAGQSAEFVNVGGNVVSAQSGQYHKIYLKVTDAYGNADDNSSVTIKVDDSAFIMNSGDEVRTWTGKATNGVIAITLKKCSAAYNVQTVVSASIEGIKDQQFSTTVEWTPNYAADGTELKVSLVKKDNATGAIVTRATGDKITLRFDQNIIGSSVDKSQFTVTYKGGEIEVKTVEVSGSDIILTLATDAATKGVETPYVVTIDKSADGRKIVTAENGVAVNTVNRWTDTIAVTPKTINVYAKDAEAVEL